MSNKKLQYVKQSVIKKILKDCDYLVLLGERSNGKSYASKNLVLQECFENDKKFIYLRRYDLDVKDSLCVNYFNDCPTESITNKDYSCIDVYRKQIYLSNIDENGKVKRDKVIGYCHALSASEHYKSLAFPDVDYIIYEEMVSAANRYIYNETQALLQYVSTIFRNHKGKVILIGNTISRLCPYYNDFNLNIEREKLGSVSKRVFHNDNGDDTRMSIYLTDSLNFNSGMFFGLAAKNITKGSYEVQEQPHLPRALNRYNTLYTIVVEYNNFKYLCELFQDKDDPSCIFWYVQPKTTEIQNNTRVISNKFNSDPCYTMDFRTALTEKEKKALGLFGSGKVCYSDNLTGTEFKNIIKELR